MHWLLIGLIWLFYSVLLVVFVVEWINSFRKKPSMTKDDFIVKNSTWDIIQFLPLGFISFTLSVLIIDLDGSETWWYAYFMPLLLILVFIFLWFGLLKDIRWKIVIKNGKIEHYRIGKIPYQSFEIEDVSRVMLSSCTADRLWTITFYHDKQRPIHVTEYYSRYLFSKKRKGFDLLFDLLEGKMLRKNVSRYKKWKETKR